MNDEKIIKELLSNVFYTGHDQGFHEVENPDFELFYRDVWEDKIF